MAGDKPRWWHCATCDREFAVKVRALGSLVQTAHDSKPPKYCPFCRTESLKDHGEDSLSDLDSWR